MRSSLPGVRERQRTYDRCFLNRHSDIPDKRGNCIGASLRGPRLVRPVLSSTTTQHVTSYKRVFAPTACVDVKPLSGDAAGRVEQPGGRDKESAATVPSFFDGCAAIAARARNTQDAVTAIAPPEIALKSRQSATCIPHRCRSWPCCCRGSRNWAAKTSGGRRPIYIGPASATAKSCRSGQRPVREGGPCRPQLATHYS
jgi:hypothetical protein